MATRMPDTSDDQSTPQQLGHTVAEISEKASLLVREEIELAKAEVGQKVKVLGKGAVTAAAAGVFAVLGLIFALHALSWFFFWLLGEDNAIFWGFLITTGILFLFAGIAAFLGLRWIKKGAPPTPNMAIDEAKRIKETVSS
jgi:hypothetical protein